MKSIFVLAFLFLSLSAFASLSNENNSHTHCVALGSPSADAVVLAGDNNKAWDVQSVTLEVAASVTASDTDYAKVSFKKGSTVVAELDTRAAHEDGLTLNTIEPLNLVSAEKIIAKNSVLSFDYDETDTGALVALTGAIACVHYLVK